MDRSYGGFSTHGFHPSASTGSLAAATRAFVESKNIPLHVTFEITVDCNLRCHHCYNFDRDRPKNEAFPDPALSDEKIFSIIDQLYDEGCLEITLTGGEALVHPSFFRIVEYIRKKYMGVYLKTNGMLLTPAMAEKLKKAGIFGLEISLYGGSASTHDKMTRAPGSFEKIVQGIKNGMEQNLWTKVNFVLTSFNYHETDSMIGLCENIGVPYNLNPQISARYDGTCSSLDNTMTRAQLEELYGETLKHMLPEPDLDPEASVQCSCAVGMCGISAYGEVYPCIGAPVPAGNLRHKPFAEIWHHSPVLNKIRGLTLDDFKVCKPCPHRGHCRRSSGTIFTNTGNYTGPEEWTCMEAEVLHNIHDKMKK